MSNNKIEKDTGKNNENEKTHEYTLKPGKLPITTMATEEDNAKQYLNEMSDLVLGVPKPFNESVHFQMPEHYAGDFLYIPKEAITVLSQMIHIYLTGDGSFSFNLEKGTPVEVEEKSTGETE